MAEDIFNLPDFAADGRFYRDFQKELDGVVYPFIVQYSSRLDRYLMSIGENVNGQVISAGVDLIQQYHHFDDIPPGKLVTHDYDGLNRDPVKDTFGSRITLKYIEADTEDA